MKLVINQPNCALVLCGNHVLPQVLKHQLTMDSKLEIYPYCDLFDDQSDTSRPLPDEQNPGLTDVISQAPPMRYLRLWPQGLRLMCPRPSLLLQWGSDATGRVVEVSFSLHLTGGSRELEIPPYMDLQLSSAHSGRCSACNIQVSASVDGAWHQRLDLFHHNTNKTMLF